MNLFKKITSIFLVISLLTSLSLNSIQAAPSKTINNQNTKEVTYVGDNKLIFTENDSIIQVAQYDKNGNFVEKCTYNKKTKKATGYNDKKEEYNVSLPQISKEEAKQIQNNNIINTLSMEPSNYSFISNVLAFPSSTLDTYSMKVYHRYYDMGTTTYSVRSYSGTLASFVVGVAVALAVPPVAASVFINECVSCGIGIIVGETLHISTTRTWAADEYASDSSKNAYYRGAGYKYVIIDRKYTSAKTTYYTDYAYQGTNYASYGSVCESLAYNTYGEVCDVKID